MNGDGEELTGRASVSVVIPTRNRGALLRRSVMSVLSQSQPPHEIIVVDDHSSEDIGSSLQGLESGPTEIRIVRLLEGRGANAARNLGAERATGSLLAFQDSDDVWLPSKLESQVAALEALRPYGACVVFCSLERRLADGRVYVVPAGRFSAGEIGRTLLYGNYISTQTALMSRQHFLRYRFDVTMQRLQDWELWLRMASDTTFCHVAEPLVTAYETGDSITNNTHAYGPSLAVIVNRNAVAFNAEPEALAAFSVILARDSFKRRDLRASVRWLVSAVRADLRGSQQFARGRLPRIADNAAAPVTSK